MMTSGESDSDELDLSFVVPALNEEAMLGELIPDIRRHCPDRLSHEIIVVDNGSSDGTVGFACELGATVIEEPRAALGEVRNSGARAARGRLLVFLDADVRLSAAWSENLPRAVNRLRAHPRTVTGSPCQAPPESGWIARAWSDFSFRSRKLSHIGTGHMIADRRVFLDIGGFDPHLATGEDFEFCHRARAQGLILAPDVRLRVSHVRLPVSLREFARREVWHGSGDSMEPGRLVRSPVAIASLLFVALHIIGGVLLVSTGGNPAPTVASVVAIAALCLIGAIRRGGTGNRALLGQRTLLVYVYLWSRFLSILRGHVPRIGRTALRARPGAARQRGW